MKTKEELNALKEEVKTIGKKLDELTNGELEQVVGGADSNIDDPGISGYKHHRLIVELPGMNDDLR